MSHLWIVQWIYVLHPLHSSCIPLSIKQTIILTPKNYINNFYMGNSPANINSKMKQGRAYRATKQDFEISQSHKLLFLRLRYLKYVVSSCHQLFTSKKWLQTWQLLSAGTRRFSEMSGLQVCWFSCSYLH